MTKIEDILLQLVGNKGLNALKPLLKNEGLAAFVGPRTVIGFLKNSSYGILQLKPFEFLIKKNTGYCGRLLIKNEQYNFNEASEEQVAAMISVVLDHKIEPKIKGLDLAKLSKTLDLLLKTEPKYEPKEDKSSSAKQIEPIEPVASQPAERVKIRRRGLIKTMLVTDKESKRLCKMCGKPQFDKKEFKGCTCLTALAKSIRSEVKGCNYLLTFGNDCGIDELMTVAEAIGRV
jgi:hypothetical protein